jgi:hypothetical protein
VLVGIGAAIDQGGQKGSETPVAKEPTANQPTANDSTDREPKAETAPDEALGSRDNPYPLGTVIHGKEYDVTVNSVTVGATDAVLAANMLNQAPPEGQSYAVINLTITYTGEGSGFADFVTVAYVASTGEVYDGLGTVTVAPEPTIGLDELYSGGTVTGNKVLPIPDGETGLLRVSPGVMANEVFVAL